MSKITITGDQAILEWFKPSFDAFLAMVDKDETIIGGVLGLTIEPVGCAVRAKIETTSLPAAGAAILRVIETLAGNHETLVRSAPEAQSTEDPEIGTLHFYGCARFHVLNRAGKTSVMAPALPWVDK